MYMLKFYNQEKVNVLVGCYYLKIWKAVLVQNQFNEYIKQNNTIRSTMIFCLGKKILSPFWLHGKILPYLIVKIYIFSHLQKFIIF